MRTDGGRRRRVGPCRICHRTALAELEAAAARLDEAKEAVRRARRRTLAATRRGCFTVKAGTVAAAAHAVLESTPGHEMALEELVRHVHARGFLRSPDPETNRLTTWKALRAHPGTFRRIARGVYGLTPRAAAHVAPAPVEVAS